MPTVATPTAHRQPPPRRFENYVFTRLVSDDAGLTDVRNVQLIHPLGPADYTGFNVGQGFCDDGLSNVYPIGFDFQLDRITYKQFVVNANGWMALVDPTQGYFIPNEVLNGEVWQNPFIRSTFSSNAVLLAPWFDDLRNVLNDPTLLAVFPFGYSQNKIKRFTTGLESSPPYLDETAYAVGFFNDTRSRNGRRLIVRWNSLSNNDNPSAVLRFEVVLYENGTIEFRYAPRKSVPSIASLVGDSEENPSFGVIEGATIGIFMPNGTNRFRDFAIGLGHRDDARQEYTYGGFAYTPSYVDTLDPLQEDYPASAPYTIGLRPSNNWPGLDRVGSVITFSPPVTRRRVLPRRLRRELDARLTLPTVARTGDTRLGTSPSFFDDRLSPNYVTGTIVNYPTTLIRFFGGTGAGTLDRQDLFSGDFLATGSISKLACEQFVGPGQKRYIDAFNETDRFEQDRSLSYFATGTPEATNGYGFAQPTWSKTQVRVSLPVHDRISMPGLTSSIYYYNRATQAWQVPTNSTYSSNTSDENPNAVGGDWADPSVDGQMARVIEDARGFGPIGNVVGSGSHHPYVTTDQTDATIGSTYTFANFTNAITRQLTKSVRINSDYRPSSDETFTAPITSPFLVEKVVIELPLKVGPGWFNDQTQCFNPIPLVDNAGGFDFAGPGLTVAMWRSVRLPAGSDTLAHRDLIATGTISHVNDTKSLVMSNFPPYDTTFQLRPLGFTGYGDPPTAIVRPNASNAFTGSVQLNCESLSSTGVAIGFQRFMFGSTPAVSGAVAAFIGNPTMNLKNQEQITVGSLVIQQLTNIAYINPLGRDGNGFEQSGRSILGKEYATFQSLGTNLTVPNPFYATGSIAQQINATLSVSGSQGVLAQTVVPIIGHFRSPYLLLPGDDLVISVSKMRPFVFGGRPTGPVPPTFSGSFGVTGGHDVVLDAGTINITLYGSQVSNGVEFHDTLNQPLASDVVHELIGADPVLDQFDVAYRSELTGSYLDNFVLGNMLSRSVANGQLTFTQGTRSRKLSRLNPRNVAPLSTSVEDIAITPSKAYRLQPWYERTGDVRLSQHVSETERYFDSMMPAIDACFATNGAGIWIEPGKVSQAFGGATVSIVPGRIIFDFYAEGPLFDNRWTKSFPFEPRYQNATRMLDVSKSFRATLSFDGTTTTPITPKLVTGFFFGPFGHRGSASTDPSTNDFFHWVSDVNVSTGVTGSSSTDDALRALYGFGDYDCLASSSGGTTFGTSHFATPRDDDTYPSSSLSNLYAFSPVIRGWKYGVHSGVPLFSKSYWRKDRFGHNRDMLEQRAYAKFYEVADNNPTDQNFRPGVKNAIVTVRFLDADGTTSPDNTWSNNLSFEVTSSLPYTDNVSRNRPPINLNLLNQKIVTVSTGMGGNVTL